MNSEKAKKIIHLGIILLSVSIGTIIIAPILNIEPRLGGLVGGILGVILFGAIFSEKKRGDSRQYPTQSNEKHFEKILARQEYGFYQSFFHPTQLPITLSFILLILLASVAFLFEKFSIKIPPEVFQFSLLGMPLLWGISGFLILTRNEFIDNHGRKHKGFWAILNGTLLIVTGWGGIIFVILATIFKW
jgi:hypothetical protein